MRQRLLTFALVVGCAALFAVSAILTMAEDKKAHLFGVCFFSDFSVLLILR